MKKVGYNPKNDRIYLLTCCGKTDKVYVVKDMTVTRLTMRMMWPGQLQ